MIAYDFQFTEASDDDEADNALFEAVAAAPRIVLGTDRGRAATARPTIFGGGEGARRTAARRPADTRFAATTTDGTLRRHAVRRATGSTRSPLASRPRSTSSARKAAHCRPATARGSTSRAAPGTFHAAELRRRRAAARSTAPAVRGKIVVVGATAQRAQRLSTSTGGRRPDAGRRRSQAARDLDRAARLPAARRRAVARRAARSLLLAVVAPLVALRFGAIPAVLGAGCVAIAIYLVAAQLAFNARRDPRRRAAAGGARSSALVLHARSIAAPVTESPRSARLLERLSAARRANQRTRRIRALAAARRRRSASSSVDARRCRPRNVLQRLELSTVN